MIILKDFFYVILVINKKVLKGLIMKKAFVTGASGFLGVNLVETLIREEWDVTVLVLPEDPMTYLNRDKVTRVTGNILSQESLRKAMPQGESVTVFHVAGMTSMWHKKDRIQYEINVIGTKNVCEIAIKKQVKKLVFTSAISAYGYHRSRVNEKTISNALTCKMNYNRTKYLGEKEIHKAIQQGLGAVILNPCNIVGPYDTSGWATLILSANKGNAQGATDGVGTFAHVQDVVNAHIQAAEKGRIGENYLLGGVEASFKEVITAICKLLHKQPPRRSISPCVLRSVMIFQEIKSVFDKKEPLLTYPRYKRLTGNIICDDSKAREVLNFKSSTLDEMLQDSYEWLKKENLI